MRDESGNEIWCPYCGSPSECPHLLAAIDRTFSECRGGYAFERYDEFRTAIERAFLRSLRRGGAIRQSWNDPELSALWDGALKEWSIGDEGVTIDLPTLDCVIVKLFAEAGALEYPRSVDEPSTAPGFSSVITLLHAEHPRDVFEAALSNLNELLLSV